MFGWDLWKKGFDAWENATAEYAEKLLKSPLVLTPGGAMLSAAMKAKAASDKASATFWGNLGLPTKRDQERTLHALNQLQSRLIDLEERLADQAAKHP
ncbi:MAG: hypothetical protein FJ095_20965 [Deltaproteobacteria bacterium]|nr:hypothetical protein [Deltaproteobacteria bacterium]